MFRAAPPLELKKLEAIFRHKVLRMLLSKGKITEEMIAMLSTLRHSVRIISSIEDPSVIRAILDHLGIRLVRSRPPPKIHDPPIREYADDFYSDPDYSWDQYIQS